jgi:hypothetical protein
LSEQRWSTTDRLKPVLQGLEADVAKVDFVVVARGKVDSSAQAAIDDVVAGMYSCGSNLASF